MTICEPNKWNQKLLWKLRDENPEKFTKVVQSMIPELKDMDIEPRSISDPSSKLAQKRFRSQQSPSLDHKEQTISGTANFERLQANLERTTEDLSNILIPVRQTAKRRVESKGGRAKPKSVGAFECKRCTFQNSGGDRCAVCGYERPAATGKAGKKDSGSFSRKKPKVSSI
eukprot:jgi/Bigna1/76152/fgenesh1_pg.39_\